MPIFPSLEHLRGFGPQFPAAPNKCLQLLYSRNTLKTKTEHCPSPNTPVSFLFPLGLFYTFNTNPSMQFTTTMPQCIIVFFSSGHFRKNASHRLSVIPTTILQTRLVLLCTYYWENRIVSFLNLLSSWPSLDLNWGGGVLKRGNNLEQGWTTS